jgi:oligoendopeptidase F
MFTQLTKKATDVKDWTWDQYQPYIQDLLDRPLTSDTVQAWLGDWTHISGLIYEVFTRLELDVTCDTQDEEAERRFNAFLDGIYQPSLAADQRLKEKLLASGLEPAGMEIPLRNMRAEVELFSEANLPLLSEERKLGNEYAKIIGGQTVELDGKEFTISQLRPIYLENDRARRERAWRLAAERQLADRQAINENWVKLYDLRQQLAANAGKPDYRAYKWQDYKRFDYTPEDCIRFHAAIEEVVVPAAQRIYEKRRERLGLDRLRPWDLNVDPLGRAPLRPFSRVDELVEGTGRIFDQVDPQLGAYFNLMRQENLLDLENRKGKAPGAYCTEFFMERRPFIFENAVGMHDDVQTLLHEGGHAFHVFESSHLPYLQQSQVGMEFAEVASMSMELLASPYITQEKGGFYSSQDAARARIEHLEGNLLFWPYMAVVDAFQHWAYTHPEAARIPEACDDAWAGLWDRFMSGVDWSGLEEEKKTGWHRKLHIHTVPFYYVEYGLAQLGAFQVFRNARQDQAQAVAAYRQALALGGTAPLPELFSTAGARFAFDAATLGQAVEIAEQVFEELEAV